LNEPGITAATSYMRLGANTSIIIHKADRIVNYSISPGRRNEGVLFRHVLGERLNEVLKESFGSLTGITESMVSVVDSLEEHVTKLSERIEAVVEALRGHTHIIAGQVIPGRVSIRVGKYTRTAGFAVRTRARRSSRAIVGSPAGAVVEADVEELKTEIESVKEDIEGLGKIIRRNRHLSRKQYLN